ncbi:MAG: hypothetical protein ACE5OR_06495, partial [bacterium]
SKLRAKFVGLEQVLSYISGTYKKRKPWAEISDEACLQAGCHEKRLLSGRAKFKRVYFDHGPHLTQMRRGKRIRCTSCHSQIVQGKHITVTESTCFLCHFKTGPGEKEISGCHFCHDAPQGSLAVAEGTFDHAAIMAQDIDCHKCHGTMTVGDGAVPRENCYSCHWEQDRLDKYDQDRFLHDIHLTQHKIECQACHLPIQHKSPRMAGGVPDCHTCHPHFHQAQADLYAGTGGKGVPSLPSPMFESSLSCQGCHVFHQDAMGFQEMGEYTLARPESCEPCHGKGYQRILKQWKETTSERVEKLNRIYLAVEKEVENSKKKKKIKNKARALVEEARFNINLVRFGGSIHNIQYADKLLTSAYQNLKEAIEVISSSYRIPQYRTYSDLIPSGCASCHYGQEEINVKVFGLTFSHNKHIVGQRLKCNVCHSNVRKHGELILSRKKCLECHHKNGRKSCQTCHETQAAMYYGTLDLVSEKSPDAMAEAEVQCVACHGLESGKIVRSSREKCVECHGDGYDELMVQWQEGTKELLQEIEKSLAELKARGLDETNPDLVRDAGKAVGAIKRDGSFGVHNIALTESLLDEQLRRLKSIL